MISFNRNNEPKIIKPWNPVPTNSPEWLKCSNCKNLIYAKQLKENLNVCPKCNYYFKMSAIERIELLLDLDSFSELFSDMRSFDILGFDDGKKPYSQKLKEAEQKTSLKEAIITGEGLIDRHKVCIGVMEFDFIGGSMGVVVGEKVFRLAEYATEHNLPLIIVSASGGARMQEGMFSLMQMARTSAAIGKFKNNNGLYVSILTNPTTGGVSASFSFLGDIIIAEPNALIGFAGARVIEQTTKQKLPPNFQTAEFLLDHGFIDKTVERKFLKKMLSKILTFYERSRTKAEDEFFTI